MNDRLRRFMIKNKPIIYLVNGLIKMKNKQTYFSKVEKRKELDFIEDYKEISGDLPYYPFDLIPDNNLYGISYIIKKYMNIPIHKNLNVHVEHGLYFGSYVSKDTLISFPKKIITFSKFREININSLTSKKIIKIGPYIKYAKPLLNEFKLKKIKEMLGKVLLVFPSHSVKRLDAIYDKDYFVDEINELKKDFDTVLICLYHLDVQNEELVSFYKNRGFKIVCAGHKYDCYFLARLRSIIELSDLTISNSLGTHVAYCEALNKNHRIFENEIKYEGGNQKEKNIRNEKELSTYIKDKNKLVTFFAKPINNRNKKKKKELINHFFGIDSVLIPSEIKKEIE